MAQELAKAKVKVLDGRNKGQELEVIFNPTEYSLEIANSFQEAAPPGLSNPIIQFVNGQNQVLTMDLLFDTYTDGQGADVSERTKAFAEMLEIDGTFHAPPRVEFKWGVFSFKAVVEKLSQRFTMFLSDGTPVRATLNVTFKQFRSLPEQLEQPRRNSADKTKRRVFTSDDSLWHLAFREFREPKYWRLIAQRNRIDDPFAIEPGDALVVPPLEETDTRDTAK
jgi:nucleoid-associated protein YgaU